MSSTPSVLIADDHAVNRKLLKALLTAEGYSTIEVENGRDALDELRQAATPLVGLIDWEMPELSGVEVCRSAREMKAPFPQFLILVTVRDHREDVVTGLKSGANDYVTKPFDQAELLARVRIGAQMVALQQNLALRVWELETALAQVKQLSGLLPICSYCKKIRDDQNYWQRVEEYLGAHSEVKFTHGICPSCEEAVIAPSLARLGIAYPGAKPGENSQKDSEE